MRQITEIKLAKLNTFELFKHYAALSSSLSLLTPQSQELAIAELESCAKLRSSKIDGIHYHITQHQKMIEVGKEEKKMIDDAIKHHESEVKALRSILTEIRRRGFADDNKIIGKNYQFNVSPLPEPTVEISVPVEEWDDTDQQKYAMVEESTTITTCKAVNDNKILRTTEKVKSRLIPNPEAIKEAYASGSILPPGIKVKTNFRITTKRLLQKDELD